MALREAVRPVRMERVALVAPQEVLPEVLAQVADAGTVEIDSVADRPPNDVTVAQRAAEAERRESVAALTGWIPASAVVPLRHRVEPLGGAVVTLRRPPGADPPTLLHKQGQLHKSFSPLVETYATVPYANVDPTVVAGIAYVVMFGMMFADAGHGALLVLAGLLLRAGTPARLAKFRSAWVFAVGAGLSSMLFGALFGEFFGPTGVLPVVWLAPLEDPVTLLLAAIGVGAVLLAGAYALGVVNRYREGGWQLALVATSGIAGAALFLGLGLLAVGIPLGSMWLVALGAIVGVGGLCLVYLGLLANAGGGGAGVAQATIELFDALIRLGTNLVSFARLAAFGLTHAALGGLTWGGTVALWESGGFGLIGAVLLFIVGNTVTFTLEAVIAGVQALRLEYYELFSKVFAGEGRPFRPWHIPMGTAAQPDLTGPQAETTLSSEPSS